LSTPIFHKTTLRSLKNSSKKCSGGTRSSSSSWSNWKKWQSYVRLSVWLRKQGRSGGKDQRRSQEAEGCEEEEDIGVPPMTPEQGTRERSHSFGRG